ncbi:hypothetical protein ZWY2020_057874 [Hordeum vulgare]|nr:hypothetical protein ZWY2020_057874 [Hordeum vulgare]
MAAAATIQSVKARQIFDSNPTSSADLRVDPRPSPARSGRCVLLRWNVRQGRRSQRCIDWWVFLSIPTKSHFVPNLAVSNVNSIIAPALIGKDPTAQTELDNFMVQ